MRFQEPGNEFEFDAVKKTSLKTKIRVVILFFCFLGIIFVIAKNNFSFVFGDEKVIVPTCGPADSKGSTDDAEYAIEKSRRALEVNKIYFESLPGFVGAEVAELPVGYKGNIKPVLKLTFSENSAEHKKIPRDICGFEIEVYYK